MSNFWRPANSEDQTDNDELLHIVAASFRHFFYRFSLTFDSLLTSFGVFGQSFGTLGLLSGAIGPQVGRITPRGRIGGEFVVPIGPHFELNFHICSHLR